MKFSEIIERTKSPRKISRVLRRDNSFSSHEPINRSSVTLVRTNAATIRSMAGNTPGFATVAPMVMDRSQQTDADRKSTRLNSSHQIISYAVFCLKKKTQESLH